MDKYSDFIGKDALIAQKAAGVKKRLVQIAVFDDEALLHHSEPVWRNGKIVGLSPTACGATPSVRRSGWAG